MKKRYKIALGVVAVQIAVAVTLLVAYWPTIGILIGTEGLAGVTAEAPAAPTSGHPPLSTGAADWPCWRGARHDGVSGVRGIVTDWGSGLTKLWEIDYLCGGDSAAAWAAPVVAGNRLVVPGREGGRDTVHCLDPETGAAIWSASYEAEAKTSHGAGSRATPFVDGESVYTFGRAGDLVSWRLLDGGMEWRRNVAEAGGKEPIWGNASSPLVVGELVIVQAGGTAGTVAYRTGTGDLAWKTGEGVAGYAAIVPLAIGTVKAVLVFHGKGLAAVDTADGRTMWNVPWETSYDVNATTPIVADGRVFITSDYGRGGALLDVSESEARIVWENTRIASHHSDPFVVDGCIYGYSGMSAQNEGEFNCLDLATGALKWSSGEIGWGTCVMADGLFVCCDIKGNLFLVRPDPARLVKVGELRGALGDVEGPVWTVPVIANGRMYLRFKQRLVCYDVVRRPGK